MIKTISLTNAPKCFLTSQIALDHLDHVLKELEEETVPSNTVRVNFLLQEQTTRIS